MRRRMALIVIGAVLLAASASAAPEPAGVPPDSLHAGSAVDSTTVVATVTYVVGSTVYFDAGREQGVLPETSGTLLRGAVTLGKLVVLDVSSRRGTATLTGGAVAQVGDAVHFTVPAVQPTAPPVAVGATSPVTSTTSKPFMSRMGIRGRAGIRYLAVSGDASHFNQPAADLALTALHPGGSPFSLAIDTRARHTYLSGGADEARTRVYRLEAGWDISKDLHLSLGRQDAPQFPSVGLIDGGRLEFAVKPVSFGAFYGTQPEPDSYAYSNDVTQYGLYSRLQGTIAEGGRWGGVLGWANSTAHGEPNRNFFYLAGDLGTRRLQFHANQDLDLNNGWKADAEGRSVTPSNTYVSGSYQITHPWAVRASFDNRRNVRLYTDRETPESQFDSSYRQGFQVGTEWRGRWTVDASYRSSRGVDGDARSGTLMLRVPRFPSRAFDVNARGTRYHGPDIDGWLGALGLLWHAQSRVDLGAHGGLRAEDRSFGLGTQETITWFGSECDVSLLSSWYLNVSAELTRGTAEHSDQVYSSLTYRF